MPKLSVIMPVYNTDERLLRQSIKSVLDQSFTDFEFIIVDDGSTNNSVEVCKEFMQSDPRIQLIQQNNAGAGFARNKGIEKAEGEYIVFPDSDDWLEADAYEIGISEMEKSKADLLIFGSVNHLFDPYNWVITDSVIGAIDDIYYQTQEECRKNWLFLRMNYPMDGPSNKIYRASVIKNNNLAFPDMRRMQDGVFNMRYYEHVQSLRMIKNIFYHFNAHNDKFQRKKMKKSFLACAIQYHETAIGMLDKWGMKNREAELALGSWFSEELIDSETKLIPVDGSSLKNFYTHIAAINNHPYVHLFYKRMKKLGYHFRKYEKLMLYRMNLLLSVYSWRSLSSEGEK